MKLNFKYLRYFHIVKDKQIVEILLQSYSVIVWIHVFVIHIYIQMIRASV